MSKQSKLSAVLFLIMFATVWGCIWILLADRNKHLANIAALDTNQRAVIERLGHVKCVAEHGEHDYQIVDIAIIAEDCWNGISLEFKGELHHVEYACSQCGHEIQLRSWALSYEEREAFRVLGLLDEISSDIVLETKTEDITEDPPVFTTELRYSVDEAEIVPSEDWELSISDLVSDLDYSTLSNYNTRITKSQDDDSVSFHDDELGEVCVIDANDTITGDTEAAVRVTADIMRKMLY